MYTLPHPTALRLTCGCTPSSGTLEEPHWEWIVGHSVTIHLGVKLPSRLRAAQSLSAPLPGHINGSRVIGQLGCLSARSHPA